jgi:hypothetical protein
MLLYVFSFIFIDIFIYKYKKKTLTNPSKETLGCPFYFSRVVGNLLKTHVFHTITIYLFAKYFNHITQTKWRPLGTLALYNLQSNLTSFLWTFE